MQRVSFREMNCSIAQTLEVVGEWWSLLIVRDALLGVSRFDEFQERLGISRNVLNDRLTRLVAEDVLEKVLYQEHPPRYDYRLTDKGRDLWQVLNAMREWGDRWSAPEGAPTDLVHRTCGEHIHVVPHLQRLRRGAAPAARPPRRPRSRRRGQLDPAPRGPRPPRGR